MNDGTKIKERRGECHIEIERERQKHRDISI